ncbi:MAG: right-handed parallel beta-helix repeat-containing protein [Rhizobacter sp.]|nr:right-handed parallel beta-helix repeat-containing protein [Ferruginibacter sp.]
MKKKISYPLFLVVFVTLAMAGCKKTKDFIDPAKILPPVITKGIAYYVSDLVGADVNNGFTITSPFKTIATAYNKVAPGDTVFLMNGTYTPAGSSILNVTKSGTASKYITFKNYPGHTPKLYCSGAVWNAVVINGSYIIFEGIELQGDNAKLDSASAFIAYSAALGGGASNPQYNTNAISIGGPNTESKFPHHVVIRNCKVHDFPGGGISSIQADYTTIEGNTVYNNAWYMMYAGSGISILNPSNSDGPDVAKYKNFVRNNICYNNKTLIPWISLVPARLSDGNGIILDVNQYPYGGSAASNKPYTGRTLVENNVSFNNGGSGIHSYRADHVDIINNTAYNNGTKVGYADIYAGSATDVKIINNIMYARNGGKCNSAPSSGTVVTYSNNIYFNGTYFNGTNDKVLNPLFVNLSTDGAVANFSLSPASPAIDGGTSTIFSVRDIKGVARPLGAAVDCGAYEVR